MVAAPSWTASLLLASVSWCYAETPRQSYPESKGIAGRQRVLYTGENAHVEVWGGFCADE
jgi:hypothetical protein